MELYLHTLHDCNVTSMSSLNTFDAIDMQSYKLGDATFDDDDLFSPPSLCEEIYFDDTLPPIYDDYCDETYAIKNKFLQMYHGKNDSCDSYFVELLPLLLMIFLMRRVINFLCLWIMIRFFL